MCSLTMTIISAPNVSLEFVPWSVNDDEATMNPRRSALSLNTEVPGAVWKRLTEALAPMRHSSLPFQPRCGAHGTCVLVGS